MSTLFGTVTNATTKQTMPDVVVTATASSLQGEQVVVTDQTGSYRIPNLPAGSYTIRGEQEGFTSFTKTGISLRTDENKGVNFQMKPEPSTSR